MVSKRELVESLVEAGFSVVDAEKKVDEIYNTVKEINPKLEEYKQWELVSSYVKVLINKTKRFGGKTYEGIVIAVDDLRDIYDSMKRKCIRMYERDPNTAILEKYVMVDEVNDEVVPLDYRKTLRDGSPNPNYGKPLPTVYSRDVYMIIDDELVTVRGEIRDELKVGRIYTFTGNRRGRFINYVPLRKFEETGVVSPYDLWDKTYELLTKNDALVALNDLYDMNYGDFVAVKGTIIDRTDRSKGSVFTIEDFDDPTGAGIDIYCNGIVDINPGTEVIAMGVLTLRDGVPRIFVKGLIPNPRSDQTPTIDIMSLL